MYCVFLRLPSYRPVKIGKFLFHIILRNKRDSNNLLSLPIASVVTTQTQADLVELSTSSLDFMDCYTSSAYTQTITLKNKAQTAIEVR